jgi:phage terminase large subunit-like protein
MVPDNAIIRHISGGKSTLGFKSYDQGRTKWQADTLDFVWFASRICIASGLRAPMRRGSMVYLTFTPLKGISDVVHNFISECGRL